MVKNDSKELIVETASAVKGGIIFGIITLISSAGLWRILQIGRVKM